jgi:hypothetical protein
MEERLRKLVAAHNEAAQEDAVYCVYDKNIVQLYYDIKQPPNLYVIVYTKTCLLVWNSREGGHQRKQDRISSRQQDISEDDFKIMYNATKHFINNIDIQINVMEKSATNSQYWRLLN